MRYGFIMNEIRASAKGVDKHNNKQLTSNINLDVEFRTGLVSCKLDQVHVLSPSPLV